MNVRWKRAFLVIALLLVAIALKVSACKILSTQWVHSYLVSLKEAALSDPLAATSAFGRVASPIAAALGSLVLVGTLFNEVKKRDDQKKVADAQLASQRFSKAIKHLDSEKIYVRLGGIYTLGDLATSSKDEYWKVIEILTGFIRVRSEMKKTLGEISDPLRPSSQDFKVKNDIQAILDVINNRDVAKDRKRVIDLHGAEIERAALEGVNLQGANLQNVNLRYANLQGANLQGANLRLAKLEGASLQNAKLQNANLDLANMRRTKLNNANLQGTRLLCTGFKGADLTEADFRNTSIGAAKLESTPLHKTDLRGANLRSPKFSPDLLKTATLSQKTIMPNGQNYDKNVSLENQCSS